MGVWVSKFETAVHRYLNWPNEWMDGRCWEPDMYIMNAYAYTYQWIYTCVYAYGLKTEFVDTESRELTLGKCQNMFIS